MLTREGDEILDELSCFFNDEKSTGWLGQEIAFQFLKGRAELSCMNGEKNEALNIMSWKEGQS